MNRKPTPSEQLSQEMDQLLAHTTRDTESPANLYLMLTTQRILQEALEGEADSYLGRGRHEKRRSPFGRRNGYKTVKLTLSQGELELRVPQVRGAPSPYHSRLLEQLKDNATSLEYLIDHLYGRKFTNDDVANLLHAYQVKKPVLAPEVILDILRRVEADYANLCQRDLSKSRIEQLFLAPVRENERTTSLPHDSLLAAWGVRPGGRVVVLHFIRGDKENEAVWRDFILDMRDRGLAEPKHIYTHGSSAALSAARRIYPFAALRGISSLLIALFALSALALSMLCPDTMIRTVVVFLFLISGPGLAFVRLLMLGDEVTELTLAIVFSLAVSTIVSEMLVLSHIWSYELAILIVVTITLGGLMLDVFPLRRQKVSKNWAHYGIGYGF